MHDHPLELSDQQVQELTETVAAGLEALLDQTCADMGPLYLDATRQQRKHLHSIAELPFVPSKRYLQLSKGSRSKYRQLASWRHAVLSQAAMANVDDADFRRAVEAVYFTPFPSNEPPYAWSQSADACPRRAEFASATDMKNHAKEGAWQTVEALRAKVSALNRCGSWFAEVKANLLQTGCRDTLADVLKLEGFDKWEDR